MKILPPILVMTTVLGLISRPAPEVFAQTNTPDATPAPASAATRLTVTGGWRAERVADASLVESPSALAIDERGRLFVAELRDYPRSRSGRR